MMIICKGCTKRTETTKEINNFIHGNNYLIEIIAGTDGTKSEFRTTFGNKNVYQQIYDQIFKNNKSDNEII